MPEQPDRVSRLLDARAMAAALFAEADARGLARAGQSERVISDGVRDLAHEMFGVDRHWHKRIVRSGPNTLHPYDANPPDRILGDDDIAFFDLGPVFDGWEADFGRTFVLGDDPDKHRLRDDLTVVFEAGRRLFEANPEITGAQFFAAVTELAADAGWEFGGPIAGHLIGEFAHTRTYGRHIRHYIAPGNDQPIRTPDQWGQPRHWILEIHLVDRVRGFGGFHEDLLDLG